MEVKANGSPLNPDQKKGANSFAQDRAERCLDGEGAWKHPKKGSTELADEILDEIAENGEVKGWVMRYDVTEVNGKYKAKLKSADPWVKCK